MKIPKLVRFFLRGRIAVLVAIGLAAAAAVAALSPVKGGLVTPAAVLAAESKAVPAGPQIQADAPTLISMRKIMARRHLDPTGWSVIRRTSRN